MTAEFTDKSEALAFAIANGIREDVFNSRMECGWSLDRAARQPLKPPAPAVERRRSRPAPVLDLPPPHVLDQWERVAVKCGVRPLSFRAAVKRGDRLIWAAKAWGYTGRLPSQTPASQIKPPRKRARG